MTKEALRFMHSLDRRILPYFEDCKLCGTNATTCPSLLYSNRGRVYSTVGFLPQTVAMLLERIEILSVFILF